MTVCGEKVTGVCVAAKCPHFKRCCPVVWDKYGKSKPQTNEEWRKTCSAEEFTEWITDKINAKLRMALHDAELYPDDINENEYMENEDEWVEWLKQPHHKKE